MAAFKPKNVAIICGVVCAGLFAISRVDRISTPGMKNIENRHSAAGGGHNSTPAGGSPMGQPDQIKGRQETDKGVGSKYFQKHFDETKPESNAIGKAWNKGQYGSEQTK